MDRTGSRIFTSPITPIIQIIGITQSMGTSSSERLFGELIRGLEDPRLYLRRESFIVIGTFVSSTIHKIFLRAKFDLTQSRISSSEWRWDTKMKDLLHSESEAWFPSRHTFTQSSNAGEETLIKD